MGDKDGVKGDGCITRNVVKGGRQGAHRTLHMEVAAVLTDQEGTTGEWKRITICTKEDTIEIGEIREITRDIVEGLLIIMDETMIMVPTLERIVLGVQQVYEEGIHIEAFQMKDQITVVVNYQDPGATP